MTVVVDDAAFLLSVKEAVVALTVDAVKVAGESAEHIAERARELVARSTDPAVAEEERRRGDLPVHASIEVRATDKGTFEVTVESEHGLELEFGTSRTRAQPYMRPAVEEEVAFGGRLN